MQAAYEKKRWESDAIENAEDKKKTEHPAREDIRRILSPKLVMVFLVRHSCDFMDLAYLMIQNPIYQNQAPQHQNRLKCI